MMRLIFKAKSGTFIFSRRHDVTMGGGIKKYAAFIKRFHKCTPSKRQKYLKEASAEQVRSLCECALNVTNGNIPIKGKLLSRLKPHKKLLRTISFGKGGVETKRRLLIQKGGFLPALAAAIIPLLGNLLL